MQEKEYVQGTFLPDSGSESAPQKKTSRTRKKAVKPTAETSSHAPAKPIASVHDKSIEQAIESVKKMTKEQKQSSRQGQMDRRVITDLEAGQLLAQNATRAETKVAVAKDVYEEVLPSDKLNVFDRAVLETVYSLIKPNAYEANAIISVRSILMALNGKTTQACSFSDKQRDNVMASLLKLMGTIVAIPVTKLRADGTIQYQKKTYLSLIPGRIEEVVYGQNVSQTLCITDYPAFYAYAAENENLEIVPLDMSEVPNVVRTDRVTSIISYLSHLIVSVTISPKAAINRRELLPDDKNLLITYDAIYKVADAKPLADIDDDQITPSYSGTFTNRVRNIVRAIMKSWKEKGYIEDWEDLKGKNNAIKVLKITVPPLSH